MLSRRIMVVSGEESGERYGAMLVEAIKAQSENIVFSGMGGEEMRKSGVDLICDIKDLSVVGFIEVLSNIGSVLKALKNLKRHIIKERPNLLILIDFPDFNIKLAKYAKKLDVKILYFISPQVWAWRKKRIKLLSKIVDQMIVIFPFEEEFYKEAGIKAKFVGHPLLDIIDSNAIQNTIRKEIGLDNNQRLIGLLPGSRRSEVTRILPVILQGAKLLSREFSNLTFIIPAARGLGKGFVERFMEKIDMPKPLVIYNKYYDVLDAIDFGIVASGTATIEMAMMEKPMVIVYKLNPLTYLIAKMFVRIESFGMVNLIAGREIVPEILQNQFTGRSLYENVKVFLEDNAKVEKVKYELSKVKEQLGGKGMFKRTAEIVLKII